MKKNSISRWICLFSFLLFACFGRVAEAQNVGIGTSSPGQKLEVAGNVKIGDNLMVEGSADYKVYRNLATFSSSSTSLTGAIVLITTQPTDCMWSITIRGQEYVGLSFEYTIWGTGISALYHFKGTLKKPITTGSYLGKLIIIIGDASTVHNQPKLTVAEFRQGRNNISETWAENWSVNVYTDLSWVSSQTAGQEILNDLWSLSGQDIYYNNGKVGIGLTSPLYPLHGKTSLSTTGSRAIYGINDHTNTGAQLYGLVGEVKSTETADPGAGVYGFHNNTTGSSAGVKGVSNSSTGRGVFGYATDNFGLNAGVYGKTNSSSGYAGYFEGGVNYFQGDVGIGIYPSNKLHVSGGNFKLENGSGYIYLNGTNTTSGQAGIQLQENGTARKSIYIANSTDNFHIFDNVASHLDMTITPSGDVGIGTSSPTERLHVFAGDVMFEDTETYLKMKSSGSTSYSGLLIYNNSGVYKRSMTYNNSSDRLYFYNAPNSHYDMTIMDNGNIGMGSTDPATHLEVNGTDFQTLRIESSTPNDVAIEFLRNNTGGTDYVDWKLVDDNGVFRFLYSNNDFTSATDGFAFNYAGVNSAFLPIDNGNKNLGGSVNRWNTIYAVNNVIQTSDLREKENIADLHYGLDEVMQLHPVTYTWRQWPEQGTRIGLIAQEVEPVIGEVVKKEQDIQKDERGNVILTGDYTYGMSYDQLIPVLIKAIQEQQAKIKELENRISDMEAR